VGKSGRIWLSAVLALAMVAGQLPSVLGLPGAAATVAAASGSISGTVTDTAATPNPVPNAIIRVNNAAGGAQAGSAVTNNAGTYSINVPAGTYHVYFDAPTFAPQVYNGQKSALTASPVVVTSGAVTGIDAHLGAAHYVSGSVKDASGAALAGVTVDAYMASDGTATGCCFEVAGATTNSDGTYNIGLAAGATYKLRFAANTPLETWWNGHPNPGNVTATGWNAADTFTVDPVTTCTGDQVDIFNNWTIGATGDGANAPSLSTANGAKFCLDSLSTYHFNSGNGTQTVGTIKLTSGTTVLGPYQASGTAAGNTPNANWTAFTGSDFPVLVQGTYTCTDSDPTTWSYDLTDTGKLGFCKASGRATVTIDGRQNVDATLALPDLLYGVNSGDDGLSIINETTAVSTFIARLDPNTAKLTTPVALAARPSDKQLLAWNNSDGTTPGVDFVTTGDLVTIDACTGLGTKVNSTASGIVLGAIAFAADGTLYGANSNLYSIDATGAPTLIGATGFSNFAGLAIDPASGILYGVELGTSRLFTVNRTTGAATLVGALSPAVGGVGDITFDPAGQLIGTSFGSGGNLLFDINKTTGAVTNARTVGGSAPQGLAFAPACAKADLDAAITVAPAAGDVGSPMTFTGTIHNSGPDAAIGAKLAVRLPTSVPFGTWTTSQGSCAIFGRSLFLAVTVEAAFINPGNTLICNIGGLASGASATVTVHGTPLAVGSFTASAFVASDLPDPVSTNDSATASFTVGGYTGIAKCDNGDGQTTLPFARVELLSGMQVLYTTTADGNASYGFPTLGKNTTLGVRYTSSDGKITCATTLTTNSDGVTTVGTASIPPDLHNHTWTSAVYLDPTLGNPPAPGAGSVTKFGDSDYLLRAGESDWYKIHVAPGQKVLIKLTGIGTTVSLPADFSLALFKDIRAYLDSTKTQVNGTDPLAAIQNHDAASTPDALSPDALSPDALSPDALSPDALSPDALSPDALSPDALSPDELSPDELSPDALSPDALSPDALSPDALSPDAYSGAQTATILRVSAHEGNSPEQIIQNTWTNTGDFYIRVRGHNGAFDPSTAFQMSAELSWTACSGVTLTAATPTLPSVTGSPKSVIITNTARFRNIDGTPMDAAAVAPLLPGLTTFAGRTDVSGVVLDLASNAGLQAAYAQWDAHPTCPAAANIVANGIKAIIDAYRPSLQYVVLAGGDFAVPYFRTPDQAGLGNEQGFEPGLHQETAGDASLKFGYVMTQDPYATQYGIAHYDHTFYLPDLAIGRLVETPSDILTVIGAYTDAGGTVHLSAGRALDTGYDFLADTATFIQSSLSPAMTVDPLIQLRGQTPWTADQLRSLLFARHYDIVSLNGHFSANTSLAADFATRIKSDELAQFASLFKNTLVISSGCHSGYNILDPEALLSTQNVDWAQAFARTGAELIGGTGYQYGDTDFMKYTEQLMGGFVTELRYSTPTNSAVAIGQALVNAKRTYVSGLPALRGIDEKALMESTLYGLPMWKMDIGTNGRLTRPGSSGIATTDVAGVTGLSSAAVTPSYALTRHPATGNPATGVYYDANGNIAVAPGAPVLPQTSLPAVAGASGRIPRGAVLMDATYADDLGTTPFTDVAGTELAGLHPGYSSQVFSPVRPFGINTLSGSPTFVTTPAQFKSTGPNVGILRRWTAQSYQLFYSSRTDLAAALAGSPIVYGVSVSPGDAGGVHLDVTLGASADPGIAAAFLTYTSESGSLYGSWHTIAMTPVGDDLTGSTGFGLVRHYGADVLPGTGPASDLRLFVQAVGGNGLVSMATNDGAYYQLTTGASATNPKMPTSISFVGTPPSTGTYLGRVTVGATLSGPSGALAGLPVTLTVGHSRATAITNGSGVASATFTITTAPAATLVTAAFDEDATHIGSSTSAPFTIGKATATLTAGTSLLKVGTSAVIATLGVGGTSDPQSVSISLGTNVFWTQSDPLGRIRLDALDLPLAFGPNTLKVDFSGNDRFTPATFTVTVTMYDPDSKSTGGGWILTKGSTIAKIPLVLAKKANFAFTAQYKPGLTAPVGNLEFSAKESKIELKATSFDYLAVNGTRAEIQGIATINGTGSFSFRMIAVDGSPDTFEIRIWDGSSSFDAPLYQASNSAGGGNIVIH
jgi:uncharacterized protein DUF11/carboxypeptidase family protein